MLPQRAFKYRPPSDWILSHICQRGAVRPHTSLVAFTSLGVDIRPDETKAVGQTAMVDRRTDATPICRAGWVFSRTRAAPVSVGASGARELPGMQQEIFPGITPPLGLPAQQAYLELMARHKSLYVLPTWTRTVALVIERDALRVAIGGTVPSVDACYRFTRKLREHKALLDTAIAQVVLSLREQMPEFGETSCVELPLSPLAATPKLKPPVPLRSLRLM